MSKYLEKINTLKNKLIDTLPPAKSSALALVSTAALSYTALIDQKQIHELTIPELVSEYASQADINFNNTLPELNYEFSKGLSMNVHDEILVANPFFENEMLLVNRNYYLPDTHYTEESYDLPTQLKAILTGKDAINSIVNINPVDIDDFYNMMKKYSNIDVDDVTYFTLLHEAAHAYAIDKMSDIKYGEITADIAALIKFAQTRPYNEFLNMAEAIYQFRLVYENIDPEHASYVAIKGLYDAIQDYPATFQAITTDDILPISIRIANHAEEKTSNKAHSEQIFKIATNIDNKYKNTNFDNLSKSEINNMHSEFLFKLDDLAINYELKTNIDETISSAGYAITQPNLNSLFQPQKFADKDKGLAL